MTYHIMGAATGYKTISLGEFDAWMDAQIHGKSDTAEVYAAVAWAYRGVQLRANAVSAMPFAVTRMGQDEPIDTPWPLKRLLWNTEAALCTWGAFFWLKRANRVLIRDLQWLNPLTMTVLRDADGISGFEQTTSGVPTKFRPEQIVYGRLFNPTDDLGPGVAPLQVAFEAAGIARYVNEWAAAFFKHGAVPTVLLHTEQTLPKGEAERIQSSWQRMTTGVANAWKAIVTQGGLKPEVITPPVNTLALPELAEGVRGQIAVALGIPETMLSDAANYATAVEHRQSFIVDTVGPECELIQEVVNEQLLKPLGLELTFNPQELDIMQEDEAHRAASLQQLTGAGVPLRLGMEILGYDLTEDQWAQLQAQADEKRANSERQFELQKERFAQPVTVMEPPEKEAGKPNERDARDAMRSELRLWQRKAVKRLKERNIAVCDFTSAHIAEGVKAALIGGLANCQTVDDIKALFDVYEVPDEEAQPEPERISGHTPEALPLPCPLCKSIGVDCYHDHGGLCVCQTCHATFDPEVHGVN